VISRENDRTVRRNILSSENFHRRKEDGHDGVKEHLNKTKTIRNERTNEHERRINPRHDSITLTEKYIRSWAFAEMMNTNAIVNRTVATYVGKPIISHTSFTGLQKA
jgi:hypothetical protein